jgi:hypothetical protein
VAFGRVARVELGLLGVQEMFAGLA